MDSHREDQEKVIEEDDAEGGWVDTHHYARMTIRCGQNVHVVLS